MSSQKHEIIITAEDTANRIDRIIAEKTGGVSRAMAVKLIEGGNVYSNGSVKIDKPSYKPSENETITIYISEPKPLDTPSENIELEIVYEDPDIIVVNKASGMVVHPAAGHRSGTLVNALLHHTKDLSGIGGFIRPGIVHRLDKDTSGLILIAKNDFAHQNLSAQFKERSVEKIYYAIIYGEIIKKRFAVNLPIGRSETDRKKMAVLVNSTSKARAAFTEFETIEAKKGFTLLKAMPKTGRTHQIRVHLAHIGFPIMGDKIYVSEKLILSRKGLPYEFSRLWLHAGGLSFNHPRGGERLEFHTGIPDAFDNFIKNV